MLLSELGISGRPDRKGWREIGSDGCDYRKELEHCTIRIARSSSNSKEWLAEITVGFMIVGTIKQVYEARTVDEAMEEAELVATENFAKLKGFYIRLLRELD